MNSGEPGSPRSRGPPFQAYQYLTVVPSARRFLIELMPLRRTRIVCHPSVAGIFRMSDAEVVRIALFPPPYRPPRCHFEAGVDAFKTPELEWLASHGDAPTALRVPGWRPLTVRRDLASLKGHRVAACNARRASGLDLA